MDNTTTIWVCVDCMLHHANGECGSCYDGHDEEPWSALDGGEDVTMGMFWSEHNEACEYRIAEEADQRMNHLVEVCDCETDTYSTSQCEGCGSWLHGERYAFTLWFPASEAHS